jgi:predicted metal-dependent phosphoesterase TrpH
MRTRVRPLLCELHAHTTWSDGVLSTRELVDLYGRNGFDVLCITDHVVRRRDPWGCAPCVTAANHRQYLTEIEAEGRRARLRYGLLVVPGLELTYNDLEPSRAAHALAVGCRSFVSVDDGIEAALGRARESGAATVAAHPYRAKRGPSPARTTQRFARDWRALRPLLDRYELFNRRDLYPWVAERGLPGIATGDFHRPEHLLGWKTLLPCERDEEAIVAYLRSPAPVYLALLEAERAEDRSVAA